MLNALIREVATITGKELSLGQLASIAPTLAESQRRSNQHITVAHQRYAPLYQILLQALAQFRHQYSQQKQQKSPLSSLNP
ncbi:MAG: hypothetical protein LRY40_04155 [Shewanella fodinae]|nr:hypothetical protein [Shewanella fodinae]